MNRFVLVGKNGKVVHPPGPLPHIWTSKAGEPVELHAKNLGELEAMGWLIVHQDGVREVDDEIHFAKAPAFEIKDGRAAEVWSYGFQPGAIDAMVRKIDQEADRRREEGSSVGAGLAMEYELLTAEAEAFLKAETDYLPGMYPFLEAGLYVTKQGGKPVERVEVAAKAVIKARDEKKERVLAARVWRLESKAAILAAKTAQEAFAAYEKAMASRA